MCIYTPSDPNTEYRALRRLKLKPFHPPLPPTPIEAFGFKSLDVCFVFMFQGSVFFLVRLSSAMDVIWQLARSMVVRLASKDDASIGHCTERQNE